jgi:lipoate-protein ligase A
MFSFGDICRNGPSVIIGRHQGAWKECNIAAMDRDKINFVRRASGGGAVYQDLGNTIFSFISVF